MKFCQIIFLLFLIYLSFSLKAHPCGDIHHFFYSGHTTSKDVFDFYQKQKEEFSSQNFTIDLKTLIDHLKLINKFETKKLFNNLKEQDEARIAYYKLGEKILGKDLTKFIINSSTLEQLRAIESMLVKILTDLTTVTYIRNIDEIDRFSGPAIKIYISKDSEKLINSPIAFENALSSDQINEINIESIYFLIEHFLFDFVSILKSKNIQFYMHFDDQDFDRNKYAQGISMTMMMKDYFIKNGNYPKITRDSKQYTTFSLVHLTPIFKNQFIGIQNIPPQN